MHKPHINVFAATEGTPENESLIYAVRVGKAVIKVYEVPDGYAIENIIIRKVPRIKKSYFKNTDRYNAYATMHLGGWSEYLLLHHAADVEDGLVIPYRITRWGVTTEVKCEGCGKSQCQHVMTREEFIRQNERVNQRIGEAFPGCQDDSEGVNLHEAQTGSATVQV